MAGLLTEDMWQLILQLVPQADRLGRCALVCQKLRQAAAAATDALDVSLQAGRSRQYRRQLAEALETYLLQHGRHLTSLIVSSAEQALTQLPCPALLHLDISHASPVQLGPHGGLSGVLGSCTGLTSLKLSRCRVTPDGGLSSLSVLVDLRELQMAGVFAALPGSALPSLLCLTRLDLSNVWGVEDVHHVSCLTNLSVLRICDVSATLAPSIAPGFALPASLQQLILGSSVELDLAVFAAATQLTCVQLFYAYVWVEGPGGGVSSGAALLAAVARLQQVVTLEVRGFSGIDWPAPCAAYTALTASSELQKLVVRDLNLPAGVWKQAFPPARHCPAMRHFGGGDGVLDAEAASRLVSCCPGLQQLDMSAASSPPVAALQLLSALTGLDLRVPTQQGDVAASVAAVAALTTLRSLRLDLGAGRASATRAALLPLTALRGLTRIEVPRQYDRLVAQADPEQPPDVWQQMQQWCRADSLMRQSLCSG